MPTPRRRRCAPALERRWDDALAAFDAKGEIGVLGMPTRADTVEELSELVWCRGVEPLRWYGVWLFVDWLEFSGVELTPAIRSRWRRLPQSNWKPPDETPTASSVRSSIWWDAKKGADCARATGC